METPMSRKLLTLSLTATLMGGTAFADAPRVAVDIAPVHSLVAQVMEGVGTPDLIVQPGASPHEYSLRPSEAAALQDANLVFWIGPDLTPWLTDTIETLAPDAAVTELLEADGTIEFEFREGALFEAHDDHEEDEHDDEGDHKDDDDHADEAHDDHEEEGHDDHGDEKAGDYDHADDDHDDEEAGHEGHDHGAHDPHAWLSPQNAMTWLLIGEVTATLDPVRDGRFIVFHDAYQYFEADFDFPASGAISIGDASDPSPARIAEIQGRIAEQGIDCVLAEPQFNPGLVATVLDGTDAKTGILDPLGSDLEPGSALYSQLIRNLSTALAGCM
jgi:zinc transport system substrate-binding protein